MRCTKCNHELDEHGICPNCYHIHDVQTMSNREINNFDGITIEAKIIIAKNNSENQQQYQQSYNNRYYRSPRSSGIKVRYINLGGKSSSSWLTRGLMAIGGIAIIGFFFFVALPALLTLLGVGVVAWLIFHFFNVKKTLILLQIISNISVLFL